MSSPACDALDPTPPSIDKSAFFDGAQKTTEVDGTSYGVPWYVETRLVYYRTDLAKKAGITTPPTDWAGLKEMAKAMQDKAGAKWGIGLQAGGTGSWQSIMPFAWSNGADLTKDGGKAYNFDSPEMLEAVKYYQSFFTDGISDKAAPAHARRPSRTSPAARCRCSSPARGRCRRSRRSAAPASRTSTTSCRSRPTRRPRRSSAAPNLAVFKNTKNRDTAWKFVQWLADPKTQVEVVPVVDRPARRSRAPGRTRPSRADKKLAVFGKQLETAQAPPSFATWEQVVTSFDTEMEKVTKTGADPAAALKTVQQQAESDRDRAVGHDRRHRARRPRGRTTARPPRPGTAAGRLGAGRRPPREGRAAWILALPFCLLFLVFTVWPVLQSLFMSFTDTKAKDLRNPFSVDIIGLDNYTRALSDPIFRRAARNTAYFVLVGVPLTLVMALAAAVALDRGITRFRSVVPARLLHPGHHLDRRRRRGLAVPAAAGLRPDQHRPRLGRHPRAELARRPATGRCRR